MSRIFGEATRHPRLRFDGWIAGLGTSSGTRVVLGRWLRSPFGPCSDVMLEWADGERLLLAPTRRTAEFISCTDIFDTVRVVLVGVSVADDTWNATADPLRLRFTTGRRGLLGLLLRAVPCALVRRPVWSALTDRPARVLLVGVRTRGTAGGAARSGTAHGICGRSARCRASSRVGAWARWRLSNRPCGSDAHTPRGFTPGSALAVTRRAAYQGSRTGRREGPRGG